MNKKSGKDNKKRSLRYKTIDNKDDVLVYCNEKDIPTIVKYMSMKGFGVSMFMWTPELIMLNYGYDLDRTLVFNEWYTKTYGESLSELIEDILSYQKQWKI